MTLLVAVYTLFKVVDSRLYDPDRRYTTWARWAFCALEDLSRFRESVGHANVISALSAKNDEIEASLQVSLNVKLASREDVGISSAWTRYGDVFVRDAILQRSASDPPVVCAFSMPRAYDPTTAMILFTDGKVDWFFSARVGEDPKLWADRFGGEMPTKWALNAPK